jgi:hypothetical protein
MLNMQDLLLNALNTAVRWLGWWGVIGFGMCLMGKAMRSQKLLFIGACILVLVFHQPVMSFITNAEHGNLALPGFNAGSIQQNAEGLFSGLKI